MGAVAQGEYRLPFRLPFPPPLPLARPASASSSSPSPSTAGAVGSRGGPVGAEQLVGPAGAGKGSWAAGVLARSGERRVTSCAL